MKNPTKNDQLLLDAVLNNDYAETKFLLSIGANPNHLFEDENGISAFHIAVGCSIELTKLFLKSEADVNLRCSKLGWTPMHVCAYWDRSEQLKLLIHQKNADPFKLCNNKNTVLETAIRNNSKSCVKIIESYFSHCNQEQIAKKRNSKNSPTVDITQIDFSAESLLEVTSDLSEISILNTNNLEDSAYIVTDTFNDTMGSVFEDKETSKSTKIIEKIDQIRHDNPKISNKKNHVYVNDRQFQINKTITISSNDEQDCLPIHHITKHKSRKTENLKPKINDNITQKSASKSRFQSPPNLPPFYSGLLKKTPTKSIETQTTSQCVVVKKRDFVAQRTKSPEVSKSPEVNNEQDDESNQVNVVSSIKRWLMNKFTSPIISRGTDETHDFQAELVKEHKKNIRQSYESQIKPSEKNIVQPRQPRASSLSGPVTSRNNISKNQTPHGTNNAFRRRDNSLNNQKPYAPIAPNVISQSNLCQVTPRTLRANSRSRANSRKSKDDDSFIDLNDIISDHIGTNFFQSVLGKSDSLQSMSKIINQHQDQEGHHQQIYSSNYKKQETSNSVKNKQMTTPITHPRKNGSTNYTQMLIKTPLPKTSKLALSEKIHTYKAENQCINNKEIKSPFQSPRKFFQNSMSSNCATLTPTTPTTYDSNLDDTIEDPFENTNTNVITLDCSEDDEVTDDMSPADRKSTSTKVGHEVNLQTSFDEMNSLSEKFNRQVIVEPKKERCALKIIENNKKTSKPTAQKRTPKLKEKIEIIKPTGYSQELIMQLENRLNLTTTSDIMVSNMFECFGDSPASSGHGDKFEWREGHIKSAFNYVLIDPRISRNLPYRAKRGMEPSEVLRAFVDSIFYIGKGSRARPYAHLHDTVRAWKNNNVKGASEKYEPPEKIPKKTKKIDRIIDVWEDNLGVVSLHIFQSVIPCEAYTREAAMIDAIGIHNLTNVKKGNYYGAAKNWKMEYKCKLGAILLKKACAIFLAEGERQISPEDI